MMKTWVKGILALSVAIGVGLGWNHIWSKSAHYLGRRHDSSTITAEADVRSHNFKLQPVDETGQPIFVDGDDTIEVKADDVTIESGTTYGDLLDQLADKSGSSQVNYREALQYFSLHNNQDKDGGGNLMWGKTLDTWLKDNHGEQTLSEGRSILNLDKVNPDKRYTVDMDLSNKDLEEKVMNDGGVVKNGVVIPIRFKESNASLHLKIYSEINTTTEGLLCKIYGVEGTSLNLERSEMQNIADALFVRAHLEKPGKVDTTWVTFGEENIKPTFISNERLKTANIKYVMPKDYQGKVLDNQTLYGYGVEVKKIQSPAIEGYTASNQEVVVNFEDIVNGTTKDYIVEYKKDSDVVDKENGIDSSGSESGIDTDDKNTETSSSDNSNNVTATPKSVTPFKVYGKQKLYRYSHANFTNKRRVQAHAKKVKAHAPMFTVVGMTTSSNGAARYQLSDGTHITANSKYVGKLYWNGTYKKLYVTNPKGINTYKSTALGQKVVHVKQGTPLTVKRMAKHNGMTRYQLASGQYISGSKKLVSPTKPKQVKRVKAKTTVRVYKDVNLKKVVKTVKKGSVITVKGWDYSHGNVHHVSGYKRYKVAGGYITANSKYVKIAQ